MRTGTKPTSPQPPYCITIPMKVTIKSGRLTLSTLHSQGYDLHSTVDHLLLPGEQALLPTGVTLEMEGVFALIQDRSGLAAKYEVSRRAGVIDSDYRKELKVVLRNESSREAYQVRAGDKIAQLLFLPRFLISVVAEGGELVTETVERDGGFGSTGK